MRLSLTTVNNLTLEEKIRFGYVPKHLIEDVLNMLEELKKLEKRLDNCNCFCDHYD